MTDGHASVAFAIYSFFTFFWNSSSNDSLFVYPSLQRRFENLVEQRLVNFVVQDLLVFQLFSNNFVGWKKEGEYHGDFNSE